jgi:hypothetical protein
MIFDIDIAPQALSDIQLGIDYYNSLTAGLGKNFLDRVNSKIETLRLNPFFQI